MKASISSALGKLDTFKGLAKTLAASLYSTPSLGHYPERHKTSELSRRNKRLRAMYLIDCVHPNHELVYKNNGAPVFMDQQSSSLPQTVLY